MVQVRVRSPRGSPHYQKHPFGLKISAGQVRFGLGQVPGAGFPRSDSPRPRIQDPKGPSLSGDADVHLQRAPFRLEAGGERAGQVDVPHLSFIPGLPLADAEPELNCFSI